MESKVNVVCDNGHKFPVNLEKNKNRDHVFCPRCKVKVVVRKKHIFSPSPTWEKERRERKMDIQEMKEVSRRPRRAPRITVPVAGLSRALSAVMLSYISAKKKREEKLKEEKRNE